jgi:hypothetical protein
VTESGGKFETGSDRERRGGPSVVPVAVSGDERDGVGRQQEAEEGALLASEAADQQRHVDHREEDRRPEPGELEGLGRGVERGPGELQRVGESFVGPFVSEERSTSGGHLSLRTIPTII